MDTLHTSHSTLHSPHSVFRVGSVQFLNASPLVWKIGEIARRWNAEVEVTRDLPARLVPGLLAGEYDVALIPVAEAARHPELTRISDACIASFGRVDSVKVLSRVPITEIRRIALDGASRSSAGMVRVCMAEVFGVSPEYVVLAAEDGILRKNVAEVRVTDAFLDGLATELGKRGLNAVLVIGDSAMMVPAEDARIPVILDMGECWTQWTGLPFVYASWFARPGVEISRLSEILNDVRNNAAAEMEEIVAVEASRRGISYDFCREYLTERIHYDFGEDERQGMEVFLEKLGKF